MFNGSKSIKIKHKEYFDKLKALLNYLEMFLSYVISNCQRFDLLFSRYELNSKKLYITQRGIGLSI